MGLAVGAALRYAESRIDFLNQMAVSERKKLSSNLLDNILPKHVSSELVSQLAATTGHAGKAAYWLASGYR